MGTQLNFGDLPDEGDTSFPGPETFMFEFVPNIDVHLHSSSEAFLSISGPEPERAQTWLRKLVSGLKIVNSRRCSIPTRDLDRFICVPPPGRVTLDAATLTIARAIWADSFGWKPLVVRREGQRLLASSPRWPQGWRVKDAPWQAIAALDRLGIPFDVDRSAEALLGRRLSSVGQAIASANLVGSSIEIKARQPSLLERLSLPALAYAGPVGTGRYRLPILVADPLLREPSIDVSEEARKAIKKATRKVRPLKAKESLPWTLYPFQARDLGRSMRIVEHTGGVLIAGEMGTGKTTISLALIDHLDTWPLLVVAPPAAFSTWQRQLGEMGKDVYLAIEGPDKTRKNLASEPYDAVVFNYDRLHQFTGDIETFGFKAIIADEIQRIRTPGSRRSRALRSLAGAVPIRVGLSGTPVTNKAEDVLPLGAFLVPGEWKPRLTTRDLDELYPGPEPMESLAEHLGTMMVRRRMTETGADLPDRVSKRVLVPLSSEQRRALAELEEEARLAKENDELGGQFHVFSMLQKMRKIVNVPSAAGIGGPSPKLDTAVELATEYSEQGRKSIIFVADRPAWTEAGRLCEEAGLGWTGIWGSTSITDRIANEKRFHEDDSVRVFIGTLASCAESLTLSPTATVTIFTALSYSPSAVAQAAARAYRLNATSTVDEAYLHATAPGGTLDDRIHEILESKRHMIARVVDRDDYVNEAATVSLTDLMYMVTGERYDDLGDASLTLPGIEPDEEGELLAAIEALDDEFDPA